VDFPGVSAPGEGLYFTEPAEILSAKSLEEVRPILRRVEEASRGGAYAVGYLTYEAGPAFSSDYQTTRGETSLPPAWFALFDRPQRSRTLPGSPGAPELGLEDWALNLSREEYEALVGRLLEAIGEGRASQVNYTVRFRGDLPSPPDPAHLSTPSYEALYRRLLRAQGQAYGAYLDLGRFQILSISPELFFERRGNRLVMRPMKGTARRGRWSAEDEALAIALANSAKDRRENLITLEWVEAELTRLAGVEVVEVTERYRVERYPTVFQMTSTIEARLRSRIGLEEIFEVLYPAASVTGVPKTAAIEAIAELEAEPREVYCGAVGIVLPGGDAVFNVPIRTLWLDTVEGRGEYGVGGGITSGSTPGAEYDEVIAKTAVLAREVPAFELLETLRLEGGEYPRVERHLTRLSESAHYFGWSDPWKVAEMALLDFAQQHPVGLWRVRLTLNDRGEVGVEGRPFELEEYSGPLPVVLASDSVDRSDIFLYHKTTHRLLYERYLAQAPDAFDVLLWNEEGALTEFTRGNLVVELEGQLLTPPQDAGLLGGTFRAELLAAGKIEEAHLYPSDLGEADSIWFINSLREWVPVRVSS